MQIQRRLTENNRLLHRIGPELSTSQNDVRQLRKRSTKRRDITKPKKGILLDSIKMTSILRDLVDGEAEKFEPGVRPPGSTVLQGDLAVGVSGQTVKDYSKGEQPVNEQMQSR
jgi:hypothetical protein